VGALYITGTYSSRDAPPRDRRHRSRLRNSCRRGTWLRSSDPMIIFLTLKRLTSPYEQSALRSHLGNSGRPEQPKYPPKLFFVTAFALSYGHLISRGPADIGRSNSPTCPFVVRARKLFAYKAIALGTVAPMPVDWANCKQTRNLEASVRPGFDHHNPC
jgi:hypothetical protein